jgi:protein-L-isoaspartate(D-aspartate) O-methyltransferase
MPVSRPPIERYVSDLVSSGAVTSEAVKRAFSRVKRHRFLDHWYRLEGGAQQIEWALVPFDRDRPDDASLEQIYSDRSLVTRIDGFCATSSTTAPQLMAWMLEALELRPGLRVLEIGTGTGYNTALLAELVGDPGLVYTMELQQEVVDQARLSLEAEGYGGVHAVAGDGFHGFPTGAPYDRIIATVGCSDVSPRWVEQLAEDGIMVVPLQHGASHPLIRVTRSRADRALGRVVGSSQFMDVAGMLACANPWQSYLIGGMEEEALWVRDLPCMPPPEHVSRGIFQDPTHRDLHFFLSLSSRELWRSTRGYGLADPGSGAAIVVSGDGVRGYARAGRTAAAERLYSRLLGLIEEWEALGCPCALDYDLQFLPKQISPSLGREGPPEWVIERVYHWETVRLPAPTGPAGSSNRSEA